jgi:hypothetical protein
MAATNAEIPSSRVVAGRGGTLPGLRVILCQPIPAF